MDSDGPVAGGLASPKSMIVTRSPQLASTRMLSLFMSPWTSPARWIAPRPLRTCAAILPIRARGSGSASRINVPSGVPSTRSITKNGEPSVATPRSSTRTTLRCDTRWAASASSARRACISGSRASASLSTFTARREQSGCSAAYTAPIPPTPSRSPSTYGGGIAIMRRGSRRARTARDRSRMSCRRAGRRVQLLGKSRGVVRGWALGRR